MPYCFLSDRMSAHNILLRLNVPAYNMVISGHFDQRWILAGVPGATECQPGWCHSQLCRSQRSVTLNSSSSSCSNTLPLWYILQIKHLSWYLDLFDIWTWEWVGFVLRLKRLQQRTKGLWLVIGHRTGFHRKGGVSQANACGRISPRFSIVSTLHQTPCKANKLFLCSFILGLFSASTVIWTCISPFSMVCPDLDEQACVSHRVLVRDP